MYTSVPIQRGWYQADAVPYERGVSTLGKEYAILLKTKTKTETRIKTMKLYNTDFFASIGVDETNTQIAMTINGKIVMVKIPNNDLKVEYSDGGAFRIGDTLADWLDRNVKEF